MLKAIPFRRQSLPFCNSVSLCGIFRSGPWGPAMPDIYYTSEDLATLRTALERVCEVMGIKPDSEEGDLIASKLLLLFQAGATDVDQLVAGFANLDGGVD